MKSSNPPSDVLSFFAPRLLSEIPIYKDPLAPKVNSDGVKILGVVVKDKDNPLKSYALVHPDHWDEFVAAINSGSRPGELSIGYGGSTSNRSDDKPK